MKKILAYFISIVLVAATLCGCGSKPADTAETAAQAEETAAQAEETAVQAEAAETETDAQTTEDSSDAADTVLLGKVITMDENGTTAEAIAVKDGKITFVGSKEDSAEYMGSNTNVFDYGNDYIYPGFIDGHSHIGLLSTLGTDHAKLDMKKRLRETSEDMKKFIESRPGRDVYIGHGFWMYEDDPDPFTHETLDKYVSDQVPVILVDVGGHTALLNQKALDYFHIKDRIDTYGTDGIKVDANGEPTGYLVETPRFDIVEEIPIEKEELKDFFEKTQDKFIAQGYTAMCDAGVVETDALQMVSAFNELAEEGRLKMKVRALYEISESNQDPVAEVEKAIALSKECNNEYFKLTGVKVFLDGVPEALTSWTDTPYTPDAKKGDNYYGYIRWNDSRKDELTAIIKLANENGLCVQMHTMGEGAIEYGLDCYESVHKALPDVDARNGLAHLSYIKDEDIARFAENDVIAYLAPHWASWKSGTKESESKIYGESKAMEMYRIKSFLDAGVHSSFHTDGMCNGGVPEMIYSAITRKSALVDEIQHSSDVSAELRQKFSDGIRGGDEKVSAMDSLKCLSTYSAYSMKEEDNLGSIEVGKSADFTIYNTDFTDEKVMSDYNCINAKLLSVFSSGRLIFPGVLY